jgi:uncharacterized protein (TIGR01777 family)
MEVIVTGSSGLLGTALIPALRRDGHRVVRLVRRAASGPDEGSWDPERGLLDPDVLAGAGALVHLAGAGIGDRRWTAAYRREIVLSRTRGTRLAAGALAEAARRTGRSPVLVSASAVGFYGDTGDREVDETAPAGSGFLAGLVRDWEEAAGPAREAGLRVACLRTGLVLSPRGGALGRMLPLFRLGLGAPLGTGRQYWPWISVPDWVDAARHVLAGPGLDGPVNLVGPHPATNADVTRELGRALRRPVLPLAVPGPVLRAALGGFAGEGVLAGQRALPRRLLESGFAFRHPDLAGALDALL